MVSLVATPTLRFFFRATDVEEITYIDSSAEVEFSQGSRDVRLTPISRYLRAPIPRGSIVGNIFVFSENRVTSKNRREPKEQEELD